MDTINALDLRNRIQKRRASFPSLLAYLGPWGMANAIERERNIGKATADLLAFEEELKNYISFLLPFLKEQAEIRDLEEAQAVISLGLDAIRDTAFDKHEEVLGYLVSYYGDGEDFLPNYRALLLYAIVLGHTAAFRPWRGKKHANELLAMLGEMPTLPREVYEALAAFYSVVLDHPDAVKAALLGADKCIADKDLTNAALLYKKGLAAAMAVPGFAFPSEEEIIARFGEESGTVLAYKASPLIKHDPIESTPEFQAVYDEVMEEAMTRYEEGGTHLGVALWGYMQEGFAKKGIAWKSPMKMNPNMLFD